jgi:uncharacterized membrane protein YgaE (UPF0421/DUF939 family)
VPGRGWTISAATQRVRGVLSPVAQASVAAGLAWYVAHDLLGHAQPFFAPIAAAVALSTSHVQRARRSVQMIVGVLLGIGVSELLHPLLGNGGISIGVVVLVTLILAVGLGVGFVGEGMMFFNQAAASAVLVIALHKAGTGAERATDALVGGAIALVIGVGLFPADPLKLIWRAEGGVLRSLMGILEQRTYEASHGVDAEPDMDRALSASHELHRRLTALTQARSTARASVRVAPRRMAMRARVEMEERRVARMYLLASGVLSLMRMLIDVREYGGDPASQCVSEINELAAALRTLLLAPRPWPQRVIAETTHSMVELTSRPLARESPASAILTTAARRVAADVIALLPDAPG